MKHTALAMLMLSALFMPLVCLPSSQARVVDSLETWDLVDSSILSDNSWEFSSEKGWTGGAAEHTTAMTADSKISFTHSRPMNLQTSEFWAQNNVSEYGGGAVGAPDQTYSWTLGPEIIVDDFDVSAANGAQIESVQLVVSFAIPDQLTQDSVRFSVSVDGQSELLKTWAHTTSGIDEMSSPYWVLNISEKFEWDWDKIANSQLTLDYVSVGGTDDSQLQVDAAGYRVVHRKASWGLETSAASIEIPDLEFPVFDLNFTLGEWDGLSLSTCGLLALENQTGTWTSEIIERPHMQSWGRLSDAGSWSGSLEVRASNNAEQWTDWQETTFASILPAMAYLQVKASVEDGCLERVRVDINDPTLTVTFNVHGDITGMIANQSLVQISISGNMVARQYLSSTGSNEHIVQVGNVLPAKGEPLTISVNSAFAWNDNGEPMSLVVEVTALKIDGAYRISWDEPPTCSIPSELEFDEDGGGTFISLPCSDDLTAVEDLEYSAVSTNEDILVADISEDQIRLSLVPEASGETTVMVSVMDRPGLAERNTWSQNISIIVNSVNDAPILDNLPPQIHVSLPEAAYLDIEFSDVDDSESELTVSMDYSWAQWNGEQIKIQPATTGEWTLTITVSDGELAASREIIVTSQALPDLMVESVEADESTEEVVAGDIVEVVGWVRNDGQEDAQFISIKCLADGQPFDVAIIDLISPGQLRRAICDWQVPADDDAVRLTIILDHTLEIRETDENNNQGNLTIAVKSPETSGSSEQQSSGGISENVQIGLTATAIMAIVAIFFMFAPKGIRKIE